MSNTRKPKWSAAEITAANAETLLAELAGSVAVDTDPKTRSTLMEIWDELDAQGRAEEFPAMAEQIRAQAARTVIVRNMAADLGVADDAGKVAMLEQAATDLGDAYWAGIYVQMAGRVAP